MPDKTPFTWKPTDIIEMTNTSDENLLLDLLSGHQRLDIGRTIRLTASALEVPQVNALVSQGKVKVQPYKVQPNKRK